MGSWSGPYDQAGRGALGAVRLTDGSALSDTLWIGNGSGSRSADLDPASDFLYLPDALGVFKDASAAPKVAATPSFYTHEVFSTTITNSGKAAIWGSEYWNGQFHLEVFDPDGVSTDFSPVRRGQWEIQGGTGHNPPVMRADGKVYWGGYLFDADDPATGPQTATSAPFFLHEGASILLPDDRILVAGGLSGRNSNVYDPASDTNTLCGFASGSPAVWGNAPGTGYEIGGLAWLPSIQRAVLFDGNGHIWHYDPAANTWTAVYRFGLWPWAFGGALRSILSAPGGAYANYYASQLDSDQIGMTLSGLATRGYLDTHDLPFYALTNGNRYFIATSETNQASFILTSSTDKPGSTTGGKRLFFSSFESNVPGEASVGGPFMRTPDLSAVVTGSLPVVSDNSMQMGCQDQGGVVLPSGQLLHSVGFYYGQISTSPGWFLWSTAVRYDGMSDPVLVGGSNNFGATLAQGWTVPDGTVMLGGFRYTPDSSDGAIPAGSRPVIDDFPASVVPGTTYLLQGRRLSGVHQASVFNDEDVWGQSFPLVRFTSSADGTVLYMRTGGFTYRGIDPERVGFCTVAIPASLPLGAYQVDAVVNGIPTAAPRTVTAVSQQPVYGESAYGAPGGAYGSLDSGFLSGRSISAAAARGALAVSRILSGRSPAAGSARSGLAVSFRFSGSSGAAGSARGGVAVARGMSGRPSVASSLRGALAIVFTRPLSGRATAAAGARGVLATLVRIAGRAKGAADASGALGHAGQIPAKASGVVPSSRDMAQQFEVGSTAHVEACFTDGCSPFDPPVVTARVRRPDGEIVVLAAARVQRGLFTADVDLGQVGEWTVRFEGSGTPVEQMILVRHTRSGDV